MGPKQPGKNSTLDEELIGPRLTELRATGTQLRTRRDELTQALDAEPTAPQATTLEVANHINQVIDSGADHMRKALIETLIA